MRGGRHLRATRAAVLGALLVVGFVWRAPPAQAEGPKPDKNANAGAEVELRDYYFLRDDLVRNKDGTVTWFYVTNHVGATTLQKSLDALKIPGLKIMTRGRDTFRVAYDPRASKVNLASPPTRSAGIDENVLLLTFPPGYKDIVEEFLERFDVAEAQVYIMAKVVELTLDSNLEYGVSWFFDRGGGDPSTGIPGSANPNSFFRAFRSQFRPGSFRGAPLSPDNTGLSLLFDDLTMDEGTITATIDALQERGSANILSEPHIVATQGQLATLVTGEQTPVQQVLVTGASETITTIFKDTGIRLDFHPLHIGREFVKLRVRVEVSSITGFVTAASTNFVVQNPVIAQRSAESVVTIRDNMTLVIGGLYAVSEIEDKVGVPILADIPVLGWLFSKKKKTKVKSELDFFITPKILRQRLAKTVFSPPSEKDRLERLKGEQGTAKAGE
jgi:type II secretory pathway component GspD/PulD (secretin)